MSTVTPDAPTRAVRIMPTVLGIMIGTLITQIEINVVGTAMPDISAELHNFALYPWVFAGFVVANTATTPAFGMLNDAAGRKVAYLASMAFVAIGSVMCGLASSMEMLIAGRLLQGCGAGGLFITAQTLLGDLFTVEKRARMQSAVWLASAVGATTGPALGGWIVTHASWRWAFFATLPVVAAATGLFVYGFVDSTKRGAKAVNWRGSALLTLTLAAMLAGVSKGFNPVLLAIAAALAIPFFLTERRAARPILPPDLFANRAFLLSALTLFFIGAVQLANMAYLGLYLQGVAGVDPSSSGYIQAVPLTVVSIACAFFVGKVVKKYGYRPVVRIGALFAFLAMLAQCGAAWHHADHPGSMLSLVLVVLGQAFMGVCHGFATTAVIICVQNQVVQARRGTATASLQLVRGIGSTLAPAVLGIVFLAALRTQNLGLTPEQFLNQKTLSALAPAAVASARAGLGAAMSSMFPALIGIGAMTFLISLLFPKAVVDVPGKP
ncbi:MAG: drug resistance transporter, EmrB/QacA subfamily [Myxococcales bacterium]|nr:drug resistance transporter, EmrB/QacA subfamily [Myxococcales bacterium]